MRTGQAESLQNIGCGTVTSKYTLCALWSDIRPHRPLMEKRQCARHQPPARAFAIKPCSWRWTARSNRKLATCEKLCGCWPHICSHMAVAWMTLKSWVDESTTRLGRSSSSGLPPTLGSSLPPKTSEAPEPCNAMRVESSAEGRGKLQAHSHVWVCRNRCGPRFAGTPIAANRPPALPRTLGFEISSAAAALAKRRAGVAPTPEQKQPRPALASKRSQKGPGMRDSSNSRLS